MIYYDITDLFHHFRTQTRVVGIPRVSTVTLQQFALHHDENEFRLIAYHPRLKKVVTTDGSFFKDRDFSSRAFGDYFNVECRREDAFDLYLAKKYKNRFVRRLHRLRMKAKAVISKNYFARKGIHLEPPELRRAVWQEPKLSPEDVVFIPGIIWVFTEYLDWLKQAKARSGVKIAQIVYDLTPIFGAQFFPQIGAPTFENGLLKMHELASVILTDSQSAKDDYLRFLQLMNLPEIDVRAVPLAHEFLLDARKTPSAQPVLEYRTISAAAMNAARLPYVICVGTREVRKNNWGLALAWQELKTKHGIDTPRLIFAGRGGWLNDEFNDFLKRTDHLDGYIKIVDGPSDADLAYLYKNCLFSVFPSFYEGWGLPIGECLWFGRPVVASNTSSMPEVGGPYVDYVDPLKRSTITAACDRMLDETYRESRAVAISSMPLRRWKDFADDVWQALHSI